MSEFCYEKNRVILPDKDHDDGLTSDMVCDGDCEECSL
jgi:hypothetical protein